MALRAVRFPPGWGWGVPWGSRLARCIPMDAELCPESGAADVLWIKFRTVDARIVAGLLSQKASQIRLSAGAIPGEVPRKKHPELALNRPSGAGK